MVKIAAAVKGLYPHIRFNSALVTKYDTPKSCIPPHSDNEKTIVPDSTILTVSLGQTRHVHFRQKPPGQYRREILEVKHGEVYTMTRESQDYFDHSVPETEVAGTRISITFRMLEQPTKDNRQLTMTNPVNSATQETNKLHKVLILSDSKNTTFDCSQLREPVVCFRENMFYLKDLDKYSRQVGQADVVLISAGINDLLHNNVNARTIHVLYSYTRSRTRLYQTLPKDKVLI